MSNPMQMDGPGHYAAAQEDMNLSWSDEIINTDREEILLKRAHVHAMLAVAAAIVDASLRGPEVVREWNKATGVVRD